MAITISSTSLDKFKRLVSADQTPMLTDDDCAAVLTDWAIADVNDNAPVGEWSDFEWAGALQAGWELKAARASILIDTTADQERASLSQIRKACVEQAAIYGAKRVGTLGVLV